MYRVEKIGSSWRHAALAMFVFTAGMGSARAADVTLSATGGNGRIDLSWTVNGNLRGVQVMRDTDANPSGRQRLAILPGKLRNYTDSSVANGRQYWYWIKYTDTSRITGNSNAANAKAGDNGGNQPIAVTGVTVTPASAALSIGSTTNLTATVQPANASNKNVSWRSSNTRVATVSPSGVVTGISAGNANITVTTADGGRSATSSIKVLTAPDPIVNYTLTIGVSGAGSTSVAPGSHSYKSGTAVTIMATPASGSVFSGWSGAATGNANPVTITMNGNQSLTATFTKKDNAGGDTPGTAGCNGNANPPISPNGGYLSINVKGTSRQYLLELPKGYDGKTPVPVMFAFHGTDTNAQEFIGPSGYGNISEGAAGRMLIVGPQGLNRGGMVGWLDFSSQGSINQADIDFFDALLSHLKSNYCVDPGRVFSMGHSAGGFISNQLACVRSGDLRGIGPFAGGGPEGQCGGKVAAFIVHNPKEGDAAECAKISGGRCPWVVEWPQYGWPTTQYWTAKNGCDSPGSMPTTAFPGNSTTGNPLACKSYSGCSAGYPVTLCLESYSDQWDGPHAFPVQWGAKAVTDFFLALPRMK